MRQRERKFESYFVNEKEPERNKRETDRQRKRK